MSISIQRQITVVYVTTILDSDIGTCLSLDSVESIMGKNKGTILGATTLHTQSETSFTSTCTTDEFTVTTPNKLPETKKRIKFQTTEHISCLDNAF